MQSPVIVAYATKHGGTAEIAERIGQTLREANVPADVLAVDDVESLAAYRAVVLGSGVYAGQWRKEAAKFLETHEKELAQRPVWFFSSGPTGEGNPVELMKGWDFPEAQEPIAQRIHPRDIAYFHGVLDFKKLSLPEKLIVQAVNAPIGDFRNWDVITAWATSIASALKENAS